MDAAGAREVAAKARRIVVKVGSSVLTDDGGLRDDTFEDITATAGLDTFDLPTNGANFADIDNDGDQDIYVVMGGAYTGDVYQNLLFENPGGASHWLTLQLEGTPGTRLSIPIVEP